MSQVAPSTDTSGDCPSTASWRALQEAERLAIEARRAAAGAEGAPLDPDAPRVGLALSGGGIRSATFCLGLVRGLAQNGLLPRFDYLSTVSGGGYVGAVLARLVQQLGLARAQSALASSESQTLQWLRRHGRYLTPRGARDLGMAIATYLRSGIAIQLEFGLLAVLVGVVTITPHLLQSHIGLFEAAHWAGWRTAWWPIAVGVWLLLAPGTLVAYWPLRDKPEAQPRATIALRDGLIALLVLLAAVAGVASAWSELRQPIGAPGFLLVSAWILTGAALRVIGLLLRLALAPKDTANTRIARERNRLTRALRRANLIAVVLFALGILDLLSWMLKGAFESGSPWFSGGLGLGTLLVVLARTFAEPLQKLAASSDGPHARLIPMLLNLVGLAAAATILVLWVALVQWIVFAGDGINAGASPIPALVDLPYWVRAVIVLLPVLGWVLLTAVHRDTANASSLHNFYRARLTRAYLATGNVQRFGPQLDGSGGGRAAQDVTEVVDGDDIAMTRHAPEARGGPLHLIGTCLNQTREDVSGLYNADRKGLPATVSARGIEVGTDAFHPAGGLQDFGTLGRWVAISGAAASPGAGAYTTPGWAALLFLLGARLGYWFQPFARAPNAAAAPGWIERSRRWLSTTKIGLLASEALASFHGVDRRCWYFSDGGHFDNTGVHALLKRELDFIVLADCGADPQFEFADIENLVRKARIDFDADIEFYTGADAAALIVSPSDQIRVISPEDISDSHMARGVLLARICYRRSNLRCRKLGTLLIVKPNLHEALDTDLLAYARRNPSFPHQSTSDQFFDEAQWESYHRLGEDMGRALNAAWLAQIPGWNAPVTVPDPVGPLRRPSFRQREADDDALAPFWRRNVKAAAFGATLGLGALGTLLLPTWQVLEEFKRQRQSVADEATRVQDEVETSLSGTRADWIAGIGDEPEFDEQEILKIATLYPSVESGTWHGEARARALTTIRRLQHACRFDDARGLGAQCPDDASRICRTVCESRTDLDEYWRPLVPVEWQRNRMVQWAFVRLGLGYGSTTPASTTEPITIGVSSVPVPDAPPTIAESPGTRANARQIPDWLADALIRPSAEPVPATRTPSLDACRAAGSSVMLYTHVYDPGTRQKAIEIGALDPFAGKVRLAPVEDVVQTAQTRGSKPPLRWQSPTLLVHRRDVPQDTDCAFAIRNALLPHLEAYYGKRDPTIDVRPLPASIRSERHVIELWLPPPFSERAQSQQQAAALDRSG